MQSKLPMHLSRRCGARTRSGRQCQSAAMPNGRCRMHGGAPGSGAPRGVRNGSYRHGLRTIETMAERRLIRELIRESRKLIESI